jgi:hypothetical protein
MAVRGNNSAEKKITLLYQINKCEIDQYGINIIRLRQLHRYKVLSLDTGLFVAILASCMCVLKHIQTFASLTNDSYILTYERYYVTFGEIME